MQTAATAMLPYFNFLAETILAQIDHYFGAETRTVPPELPLLNGVPSPFGAFTLEHQLNRDEILLLLLALAPHVQPTFYEAIILERIPQSGDFPDFGGVRGKQFRGILPTGETAVFVLAGRDLQRRFEVQELFGADHLFYRKRILWLEDVPAGEPRMSGKIVLSREYIELFTTGKVARPHFSTEFPAVRVTTRLDWEDLILPDSVKEQIIDLQNWIKYNPRLLSDWGMGKRLKPGFRVLFHGPPGTGKTLTAGLLGKYTQKDVYRIDLSKVVSKYIGETEKNLASLFDRAEDKDWILFFDEADSLFGKRTGVRDAHDKYANQEVSYLLQRMEEYNGLIILASNFKSNIDDAFMRRFNTVIKFPLPDRRDREEIWRRVLPPGIPVEQDQQQQPMDLPWLASKYELSGGHIVNAMHFACLKALSVEKEIIHWGHLLDGIKREFEKEGKIFPG